MANGIARGRVRTTTTTTTATTTTTTTADSRKMEATLQPIVDSDMQPWFIAYFFDIGHPCYPLTTIRGIEWSLRALANMRAVRLFLRARAVIKYVLRAASTLKKYRWRAASSS